MQHNPIVYGTVLLSLIGQGLSLPWFIKRLRLSDSKSRQQTEQLQAQLMTSKAAIDELDSLLKSGVLPKAVYEQMRSAYQVRVVASEKALREVYNRRLDQFVDEDSIKLDAIRRRLLLAEKGALNEAMRKRILSEEIVRSQLLSIINYQLSVNVFGVSKILDLLHEYLVGAVPARLFV